MKIITIIGARPQFIKAAMVSKAIMEFNTQQGKVVVEEFILHSGQHYDENMSNIFFNELAMPKPKWTLDGKGKNVEELCGIIYPIIESNKPDFVLLYGDTNTTLGGALAAEKAGIKIVHIEAGLRSFNNKMPEEHNRVETDKRSTSLFCPTSTAVKHLKNEGIIQNVYQIGDVMFDAALFFTHIAQQQSTILTELGLTKKRFNLLTVHRAENTTDKQRLTEIIYGINDISTTEHPTIWPLHPRTRMVIEENNNIKYMLFNNSNIKIIEPVSFFDMILLESSAYKILTDSGGVQKEAYFQKTPCITLRDETEWIETIQSGWNQLAGCNREKIVWCYHHKPETHAIDEYGNGDSAKKIIEILCKKKF